MFKFSFKLSLIFCLSYVYLQWVYTKQRDEVIANYRGYQTMDSRVHPDVVRGQKANDLISDVRFI